MARRFRIFYFPAAAGRRGGGRRRRVGKGKRKRPSTRPVFPFYRLPPGGKRVEGGKKKKKKRTVSAPQAGGVEEGRGTRKKEGEGAKVRCPTLPRGTSSLAVRPATWEGGGGKPLGGGRRRRSRRVG